MLKIYIVGKVSDYVFANCDDSECLSMVSADGCLLRYLGRYFELIVILALLLLLNSIYFELCLVI